MQIFSVFVQFDKNNAVFTGAPPVSVIAAFGIVDYSFQILVYIVEQFVGDIFKRKIRFHTLSPLSFHLSDKAWSMTDLYLSEKILYHFLLFPSLINKRAKPSETTFHSTWLSKLLILF